MSNSIANIGQNAEGLWLNYCKVCQGTWPDGASEAHAKDCELMTLKAELADVKAELHYLRKNFREMLKAEPPRTPGGEYAGRPTRKARLADGMLIYEDSPEVAEAMELGARVAKALSIAPEFATDFIMGLARHSKPTGKPYDQRHPTKKQRSKPKKKPRHPTKPKRQE